MRVLVVGLAKTGTTALMSLIRQGLENCNLVMEPHSVLNFGPRSLKQDGNEVIKVVYEHWQQKTRHLDAIVHAEFGFPVDRVVFITRDVRDQMVSKLLYHAKIAHAAGVFDGPAGKAKLARWVSALEEKERDPSAVSFADLCHQFKGIVNADIWTAVTNIEAVAKYQQYIATGLTRDHHVLTYEKMILDQTADLAGYLGFALPGNLDAVELRGFDYTKRTARSGNWRTWFTEQDVATLRPMVREWLKDDIYDDWELTPDAVLNPEECSRYVFRIAN